MKVVNSIKNKQFEAKVENDKAELVYCFREKTMFFMHTKVPENARGKGVASALAKTALEYAKEKKYKIAILCPLQQNTLKIILSGMSYMI